MEQVSKIPEKVVAAETSKKRVKKSERHPNPLYAYGLALRQAGYLEDALRINPKGFGGDIADRDD